MASEASLSQWPLSCPLRHSWYNRPYNEPAKAHHDQALQLVDEPTYRVWRLFMSGSVYGFRVGRTNVYQALLVKPDEGNSHQPLTRADWYA
ncbi:MAG: class I SAM-dependent methyltransferase [Ardenticatenia bacterium]|nr:class I SAM-dependent methyltransferase [Ardenticatenia bacterium]